MAVDDRNLLMMQQLGQHSAATTLHSVFRFLRTVRMRSGILLASIVAVGLCGAAYYVIAERRYESTAQLHIVRKGSGVTEEGVHKNDSPSDDMPTYQKLMSSDEVIARALARLPVKYKVDLVGVPENMWID